MSNIRTTGVTMLLCMGLLVPASLLFGAIDYSNRPGCIPWLRTQPLGS